MTDLDTISIGVAKGIGPARGERLAKLGIHTVADALRHFPRSYSDRRHATPIARLECGTSALILAAVMSVTLRRLSWRKSILTVKVSDDTGDLHALWFNQPYLRSRFRKGRRLALFGKTNVGSTGQLEMVNPEVDFLSEKEAPSPHLFRIVPAYPATEDLSQTIIRKTAYSLVAQFSDRVQEYLPSATRRKLQLLSLPEAIRAVHFPKTWKALERARKRLIFQEFFLLQMGAALRRKFVDAANKTRPRLTPEARGRADRFLARLPFSLTSAQMRSLEEMRCDLSSPRPMNRLLHGDVGCGKTIVALLTILRTIASGYQACLMAPTELLARQHFGKISDLLANEDCKTTLLVGSVACKESHYRDIATGRTDLVIGTQAVIQDKVRFKRLGLVVMDEQHRFGVLQRLRLFEKGDYPDVLVLSATPIPRTLCQTLYGDMDISVIDEMPPGRLPVLTRCFPRSELRTAYEHLRKTIRSGDRAYVVCPAIEERKSSERLSAIETHRRLATDIYREMGVGLLHGAMPTEERERIIGEFRSGRFDVLVTTTVIEVGIDIPDAAAILITNGECFGLAQLHQMRGRVGRGGEQGYCFVVAEPQTGAARERLEIFERTTDGFEIAREDLKLRGVGEFFGTRQHGLPETGIGNIFENQDLMQLAREEAFSIINGTTPLSVEEKEALAVELGKTYGESFRLGFV